MATERITIAGSDYLIDMDLDPEMMACRSNNRHDMRVKNVADEYVENVKSIHVFIYVTRCTRCDSYRIQTLDAGLRVMKGTTRYDLSARYVDGGYTTIEPGEAKLWEMGYYMLMQRRQNRIRHSASTSA